MCQVMGVDMTENEITLTRDAGCPEHYRGDGYITATRAMRSATTRWEEKFKHSVLIIWWWCCAFKYIWRCLSKGQTLSDIDKGIDCLKKLRKEVEPICTTSGTAPR